MRPSASGAADARLYLREAELDQGAALIRSAARSLRSGAIRAAADNGLLDAELDVLIELYTQEGCDVSELRALMHAPKQSLARNLKSLEDQNFVRRTPSAQDGRKRLLYLTDKGRAVAERAAEGWREILLRAYRANGPDDVSSTRKLLQDLASMAAQPEPNDE